MTFTINKCCDQYEISRCGVKYWINGTEHWAKGTSLSNNEVVVRIPFKATEVQALVDYEDLSEVKSVKYPTPHTCYDEKVNCKWLCYSSVRSFFIYFSILFSTGNTFQEEQMSKLLHVMVTY